MDLGGLLLGGALAVAALVLSVVVVRAWPGAVQALERGPLGSWTGLRRLLSPAPAMAVARAAAAVDDRVIDGAVRGVARVVLRAAAAFARADTGVIDGAVRGTARAFRRAGAAARRPQTGLLHQYYVQAVAGVGVLLAFLLIVR